MSPQILKFSSNTTFKHKLINSTIQTKLPEREETQKKPRRIKGVSPRKLGYDLLKYCPWGKTIKQIEHDYMGMLNRFWEFATPFGPKFRTLFAHLAYFFILYFGLTQEDQDRLIKEIKENLPDYFYTHFPIWIIHLLSSRHSSNKVLKSRAKRGKILWGLLPHLAPDEIALYELFQPDSEYSIPPNDVKKIFQPWFVGDWNEPVTPEKKELWKPTQTLIELLISREMELKGLSFMNSFFIRLCIEYHQENYSTKTIQIKLTLREKKPYKLYQRYKDIRQDPRITHSQAINLLWNDPYLERKTVDRNIRWSIVGEEVSSLLNEWHSKNPSPHQ